jgi:gliding motility-associated-like protein
MKRLFFIYFLFLCVNSFAQNHEWANHFGNSTNSSVTPACISIDSNGNSYITGRFGNDFIVDNDTITFTSNYSSGSINGFVSSYDNTGKHKWSKSFYMYSLNFSGNGSPNINFTDVKAINNNKILVVGDFSSRGTATILKLSNTDSIINNETITTARVSFYLMFDSSGNLLDYNKITQGVLINGSIDTDSDKNIYISYWAFSGNIMSKKNTKNINFSITTSVLIKFTPDFDSIVWIKNIATTSNQAAFITGRVRVGLEDGNIFIANLLSKANTSVTRIEIDGVEYSRFIPQGHNKGFLIVLSPNGDFIHKGFFNSDTSQNDNISDLIAFDTSRIYITGFVQDSINYNGQWFASTGTPTSQVAYPYIAKVSTSKADWIKLTTNKIGIAFSANFFRTNRISGIISDKEGFVYSSFRFQNNVLSIGGLLDSTQAVRGFVKMDSLGNALWLRSGVNAVDIQVDLNSDLVYCGTYQSDTLELPPFVLPFTNGISGFLAKIADYSITRGEVSSGPYCAGDTFLVPYTKMGEYDTANFFIAELSDENGNFEGGQRELGRIKAVEDSTIMGQLPLFQVASSPNYRIRVRSTHPPVQSFFRLDSLRLLIYSRDKADPGPPETVCFGDSFRLNTFGGTAWEWSPAYRMDNPNARSPLIYPDRDTLFRIIISDSSGCGEPDTAFKQIFIRPKAQIQTQTLVNACWGLPVNLTANFTQGDSSQYRWTWFNSDSSLWAPLQSDSFRTKDTFTFNYPQSNDTIRFALVLQDDCQTIKDTALITVRLSPHRISSILSTQDSIICYQSQQNLIANISGGDSATYQWQWFEVDTSGVFSVMKQDSLRFSDTLQVQLRTESKDFQRYALVSNDNCIPFFDTAYLHVNINPHRPQVDVLPSDTFVCPLTPVPLQGQLNNGSVLGYAFTWLDEANNIQQTDTGFAPALFVPSPDFSGGLMQRVYRLVAQDLCSPYGDTAEVLVNINRHQPLADILPSDTSVCPLTAVPLQGQINDGSVLGYAFTWLDEANNIQQSDTGFGPALFVPSPDFSGGLMQRVYRLVAQDLCSPNADTAQTRISPREPLQAIPNTFDTTVCSGTELSLSASGLGGDSSNYQYQWILNDNIISSDSDVGFIPPIDPSPLTIQLVLTDNCMPQNDTAEVVVRVRPALRSAILREPHLNIAVQDTTVCSGSELRFFAKAFGGDSTHYSFEWLWNDSLMGTQKELVFVPIHHSPFTLHLITKDGCTVPNDTTSVIINIFPPLQAFFTALDTLCLGEELELIAEVNGGVDSNYMYQWILNGNIVSETDSFILNGIHPSPSTLQLILSDGCSSPNDTFVHEIYIRPALTLDLAASTPCANPTTTLTTNPSGGNPDNYVIQWFDEAGNMIGEGLSIEVTPTRLTTYRASLSDGCSADTASAQIQIDLIPSILELTASPTQGCEPLEIEFEINTNYQDSFSGVLFISDTDSFIIDSIILSDLYGRIAIRPHAIRPHGIYNPSFKFISKLGCTVVSQNAPNITVHPKPTAAFSFSPEEPDLDNNSVQFRNLSTGANSYLWNVSPFGESTDFEPEFAYEGTGYHPVMLIAISDQDCRDTAEGEVYVRTNYRVFLPTAFSPNGDGINDIFQPNMRGFAESDFKVYNRWGELIYQSRNNTGWDGTYRGQPVPHGVYMYTLSVLNFFDERQFFSGTVVLMR